MTARLSRSRRGKKILSRRLGPPKVGTLEDPLLRGELGSGAAMTTYVERDVVLVCSRALATPRGPASLCLGATIPHVALAIGV